ncbi:MAG: ATP-binding protein [Catenulispora sp.]|nr:ATP-binding protein [Catenulispora sp.]
MIGRDTRQLAIVVWDKQHLAEVTGAPREEPLVSVLSRYRCRLMAPLPPGWDQLAWREVTPRWVFQEEVGLARLVAPGGPGAGGEPPAVVPATVPVVAGPGSALAAPAAPVPPPPPLRGEFHVDDRTDREAVTLVYGTQIDEAAQHLRCGNSVLVVCDKLLVEHLWEMIAARARLKPQNPFYQAAVAAEQAGDAEAAPDQLSHGAQAAMQLAGMPTQRAEYRRQLLNRIRDAIRTAGQDVLLVLPHLDLFVGSGRSELILSSEAREFADLIYPTAPLERRSAADDRPPLLAFADPSLILPDVVTQVFVRITLDGCNREVQDALGVRWPLSHAVVTRREFEAFDVDENEFYKHVAGMNPVRIRQAMRFAAERHSAGGTMEHLRDALREFKTASTTGFEPPVEDFDDIGGYQDVKDTLKEAIKLIEGAQGAQAELYRGLAPRGFVFWGPPGTGKTLFAKAVAHELQASVMVVSGPEVNGMWHGESEGRIRDLFARARRNAPSVLVFDEFDAIAQARSDLANSSRAGNAVVAQLLTEMDGFRPDVIMLVIATTNRLEALDPALLRPSRFHAVEIGLPGPDARRAILGYYDKKFGTGLDDEVLRALTAFSQDWNGDMLQEVFRQAHRENLLNHGGHWQPEAEDIARIAGRVSLTRTTVAEAGR